MTQSVFKVKSVSATPFSTLDSLDVAGKRVVVRMDLNVPMMAGRVTDNTRILRLLPTIRELVGRKARVVILSHLGRPKGRYVTDLSLAPLVDALSEALDGVPIVFGVDCIGAEAQKAIAKAPPGGIALLENLRFHPGEEKNDPDFARELARLGDVYVNDAFSCAHRAHASIVGLAPHMPSAAGRLMEEELNALNDLFSASQPPFSVIVGGSKVSTKLELLEQLIQKFDHLIIGGAMANTFLLAQGAGIGRSLAEPEMVLTAERILQQAEARGRRVHLPVDVVVASRFSAHAESQVVPVTDIPEDAMILDVGPESVMRFAEVLRQTRTLLWNGPLGAFETPPFDGATVMLARVVAGLTRAGLLKSVAGGGDTAAAFAHAGLAERLTYLSTAGGAFLEWMEGKTLPGVEILMQHSIRE
jgi:phosphoglycerate kinase